MSLKVIVVFLLLVVANTSGLNVAVESTYENVKVFKQPAIVIRTQERNYDEPNLNDFENCAKSYDSCKQLCENSYNSGSDCVESCPKCPILVSQNVVVQGINDTDFRAVKSSVVNTTNIIRLTNEIHNVIDNRLGNITARNENNVHLHSQNSTVGGKFGYGYTEKGPCCMVARNRVKRQRLCGERCTAPVMHARPKVICNDAMDIDSCKQVIEYHPYRSRQSNVSANNKCRYQQEWPFVSCRNRRQWGNCSPMCMELAYSYILKYGVPLNCLSCFKNFEKSSSNAPPIGYVPPSWLDNGEFIETAGGSDQWTLEKSKCRNPDGTISDDCEIGSGDDGSLLPEDEMHTDTLDRDQKFDDAAFGSFQSLDMPRHRRNNFRRSKYSHRQNSQQ